MDRYDCKWVRVIYGRPWAITIGQTAYYTEPEGMVGARWHRHEDKHKEQWKREGRVCFIVKYVWYLIIYGYQDNPFEVEARKAAEQAQ